MRTFLFITWIFAASSGLTNLPGADADHWSFQPIRKPYLPANSGNPIDILVKSRLSAANLEPSPPADRFTLLRRLHLDLTGLLPSLSEIESFEKSWAENPEQAYRNKVEQLLASPHFGERWARPWLDLARYADSDGYLGDNLRPWAWVYRDWVIDAINRDQPFDQFSIEQLAGDLLPDATQAQKIAAGFQRNNLKNTEAGADRELDRTKQVVDRVATMGTTWLALTVSCAECHDHKHDPISQKEFYQLYAFFNNTKDADISIRVTDEWDRYTAKTREWEAKLVSLEKSLPGGTIANSPSPPPEGSWTSVTPDKVTAGSSTVTIEVQPDQSITATGKTVPSTISYFVEAPVERDITVTGFRLDALGNFGKERNKGQTVGRGNNGQFVLSMFFPDLIVDGKARRLLLTSAGASHSDEGAGANLPETIKPGNDGWKVATKTYQPHSIVFRLAKPEFLPAGSRLKFSLGQKFGTGNSLRHFQLFTTGDQEIKTPRTRPIDPGFAKHRLAIEKLLANPPSPPATKTQTLVELSQKDRRKSFVHVRGDYTREGAPVTPATPAFLPALQAETPNRLDLARWLFEEKNPLTARVAVNQIWQELFGIGIVPTSDDFGTYGERPSHPELLDWLASEFREKDWSRKALIRDIVMSATYRQSSKNTFPDLSNELLWRQNSFRLPADLVRDVHLDASNLFSPKIGGPGIRPPLPEFVSAVGRSVKWPVSTGPERYRRGMYIFLKRTVIYPMLTTFDAPDTSASCSRRERTNTPMQALALLNDPVFFECAETLGKEVYRNHKAREGIAIREIFRRCLSRDPGDQELSILENTYQDFVRTSQSPEAAMIATARVIMNLDEFITRE